MKKSLSAICITVLVGILGAAGLIASDFLAGPAAGSHHAFRVTSNVR